MNSEEIVYSKTPNKVKGEVLDIRGEKYGRLTAIRLVEKRKSGAMWEFKCFCGNTTIARLTHVRSGKIQSCGCLAIETSKDPKNHTKSVTHGASNQSWYPNWISMTSRGKGKFNSHQEAYKSVQGKLIEEDWLSDPWSFYNHIGDKPGDNYSIDRIDPTKGYVYGNVRWADKKTQAINRRARSSMTNIIYQAPGVNRRITPAWSVKVGQDYLGTFNNLELAKVARDDYREAHGYPTID